MIDAPPTATSSSPPPGHTFSPWWLFVFGVMFGYVVFRPGGVWDYFLSSGGFRDTMTVGSKDGGAGRGYSGPGRGAAAGSYEWDTGRRLAPTLRGGESLAPEGLDDETMPRGREPDIRLPPTDLFTGGGDNGRGSGGTPF